MWPPVGRQIRTCEAVVKTLANYAEQGNADVMNALIKVTRDFSRWGVDMLLKVGMFDCLEKLAIPGEPAVLSVFLHVLESIPVVCPGTCAAVALLGRVAMPGDQAVIAGIRRWRDRVLGPECGETLSRLLA